jgi:hypothetical protein
VSYNSEPLDNKFSKDTTCIKSRVETSFFAKSLSLNLFSLSSLESPKRPSFNWVMYTCWRFFGAPNTQEEPAAVLSGQARTVRGLGPDGPRPGVRRRCYLVKRGRSAAQGRTVRDLVQELGFPAWRPDGPRPRAGRSARTQGRRKIAGGAWISLPGGTHRGGEILGVI